MRGPRSSKAGESGNVQNGWMAGCCCVHTARPRGQPRGVPLTIPPRAARAFSFVRTDAGKLVAACGRRIWMAGEREGENLNGSNEQRPNREETEIVAWSDESPERTAMHGVCGCTATGSKHKGLRLVSAFASELGLGAASASYSTDTIIFESFTSVWLPCSAHC